MRCRSIDLFEKLGLIDEGTYGIVFRARYIGPLAEPFYPRFEDPSCPNLDAPHIVAIKRIKLGAEQSTSGFPVTSLRELNILTLLNRHSPHPNIIELKEVVVGRATDESVSPTFAAKAHPPPPLPLSSFPRVYMVMEYMQHDLKFFLRSLTRRSVRLNIVRFVSFHLFSFRFAA